MSILVKGMKMPESCYACDKDGLSGVVWCKHAYDTKNSTWGRALNCPLIELPDHGRLVDADDVIEESRCGYYWWETEQQVPQILNEIPTIIPAERSEE